MIHKEQDHGTGQKDVGGNKPWFGFVCIFLSYGEK